MFKQFFVSIVVIMVVPLLVLASSSFPEAYKVESPIAAGTVVSLKDDATDTVEVARQENDHRLFGVVVQNTDSEFIIDPGDDQVLVKTVGPASMFVSDINGAIEVGDQLTISPIAGIAMKSTGNDATIGTALTAFNSNSTALSTKQVTTSQGKTLQANVGRITAQTRASQQTGSSVAAFLSGFGESIAGRPVSSFRLFTALAVTLITLVASAALLYGTIRTAIISIGRNPLSRKSVYRGLMQVFAIVFVVFVAGAAGAYIILTV